MIKFITIKMEFLGNEVSKRVNTINSLKPQCDPMILSMFIESVKNNSDVNELTKVITKSENMQYFVISDSLYNKLGISRDNFINACGKVRKVETSIPINNEPVKLMLEFNQSLSDKIYVTLKK